MLFMPLSKYSLSFYHTNGIPQEHNHTKKLLTERGKAVGTLFSDKKVIMNKIIKTTSSCIFKRKPVYLQKYYIFKGYLYDCTVFSRQLFVI